MTSEQKRRLLTSDKRLAVWRGRIVHVCRIRKAFASKLPCDFPSFPPETWKIN